MYGTKLKQRSGTMKLDELQDELDELQDELDELIDG